MERLTKRNEKDNIYHYPHCFEKCGESGHSCKCELRIPEDWGEKAHMADQ